MAASRQGDGGGKRLRGPGFELRGWLSSAQRPLSLTASRSLPRFSRSGWSNTLSIPCVETTKIHVKYSTLSLHTCPRLSSVRGISDRSRICQTVHGACEQQTRSIEGIILLVERF